LAAGFAHLRGVWGRLLNDTTVCQHVRAADLAKAVKLLDGLQASLKSPPVLDFKEGTEPHLNSEVEREQVSSQLSDCLVYSSSLQEFLDHSRISASLRSRIRRALKGADAIAKHLIGELCHDK